MIDAVEEYFNEVYPKVVNCSFVRASAMSGSVSYVETKMKERQNGVIYSDCTAHRLELVERDSINFNN